MDKFSEQFDRYLKLAHSSKLLVTESDLANLSMLFNILNPVDRTLLTSAYGLFDTPLTSVEEMAEKYKVDKEVIEKRLEKDIRLIAVSPEWQIMMRQMRPAVIRKLLKK